MSTNSAKILQGTPPNVGATVNTGAAATIYSTPYTMLMSQNWAAHFEWTGTPTSTITLWASCKPDPLLTDDTDWVDVTGTLTMPAPAGSASKYLTDIGNSGAHFYRFKVVTASGSGTISAWVTGKQLV